MNWKQTKYELQNIISGKSSTSHDALIQTISSYLKRSKSSSPVAEEKHQNKPKEAERLIQFAHKNNLFVNNIDQSKFIASGAEQKVYIRNKRRVIKLNDAIYFASWEDYFHNLLLHNYFFSDTAYNFLGFHQHENTLFSVVEQIFVKSDQITNLDNVKIFLKKNNFENIKNHDYYNQTLGIILEDLHDENVLTSKNTLYFIDTVFYIKPDIFWD